MGFKAHKNDARRLLQKRDRDALLTWATAVRDPLRVLVSLAYDADELVRRRTIEATGWVAAQVAVANRRKVKDTIRRLFWLMNDESGGLAWHAPELIGEILHHVPSLIPEYAPLLPTFLREEPFELGTHIAVYRVAQADPGCLAGSADRIIPALNNSDPVIRAYAALALITIDAETHRERIAPLRQDTGMVRIYDHGTGRLRDTTVAALLCSST